MTTVRGDLQEAVRSLEAWARRFLILSMLTAGVAVTLLLLLFVFHVYEFPRSGGVVAIASLDDVWLLLLWSLVLLWLRRVALGLAAFFQHVE